MPPDALVQRLQRRSAALERQLNARIAEIEDLRAQIAEQQRLAGVGEETARRAAEYEALMSTVTMRALRRPRAWYGTARRLLDRVRG